MILLKAGLLILIFISGLLIGGCTTQEDNISYCTRYGFIYHKDYTIYCVAIKDKQ